MRIVTDIENISLKRSVDAGTEEQRKAFGRLWER